ncbi:hypothetical protein FJT64_019757 [Amphibalanus amphitrite]|uniref:Uncharacterized protein n=1 Tax=Amphibalanus amphitrite TaxID=1232801 RepID=A0A6A4WST2_AMPAM|nr:hypothetical protein FJT64_019757 [Amphibalanus amphitrite]
MHRRANVRKIIEHRQRQHLRLTESEEKEKEALQLQIRKEKVSNVTLTGRWASEAADVCRLHRYRAA